MTPLLKGGDSPKARPKLHVEVVCVDGWVVQEESGDRLVGGREQRSLSRWA